MQTMVGATMVALSSEYSKVNGSIRLAAGEAVSSASTVNGDLSVGAGAHVDGGILYQKPGMRWGPPGRPPRMVIGPDAVVGATLVFERVVGLLVSESAKIGPVTGATPVRFNGATPPG